MPFFVFFAGDRVAAVPAGDEFAGVRQFMASTGGAAKKVLYAIEGRQQHMATVLDELCIIESMYCEDNNHPSARAKC